MLQHITLAGTYFIFKITTTSRKYSDTDYIQITCTIRTGIL